MRTRAFYIAVIAAAAVVALGARTYLAETFRIPTNTMAPTLLTGDTLFVWKWPYRSFFGGPRQPHAGDVVVFVGPPPNEVQAIRRIVGLPGDTVTLKAGRLLINGQAIAKVWPKDEQCGQEQLGDKLFSVCTESPLLLDFGPEKVGENEVLVLPDMRSQPVGGDAQSKRGFQRVPFDRILGRAAWVWLSVDPDILREKGSWFARLRTERLFHRIH